MRRRADRRPEQLVRRLICVSARRRLALTRDNAAAEASIERAFVENERVLNIVT